MVKTSANETIIGTVGNDAIDSRGGNDVIDGGAGNDTLIIFDNRANFFIATLEGETRLVGLSSGNGRYNYDEAFLTNVEAIQFQDQTVSLAPITKNLMVKTSANETITGTAGSDAIDSRGGNDVINGGAGNDTLIIFDNRANFFIATLEGETRLVGLSSGNGRYNYDEAFLTNVEAIQFQDQTVALIPITTYSLTPGTVTEGNQITFTITRNGGELSAETVYVSTLQSEGYLNRGDYTGRFNEALNFASGQTSKTVRISTTNDTVVEDDETFGLLVQRNASDSISTYVAKSTFTITSDDSMTADDYASSTSTTGNITSGQTKNGNINHYGDTDWFKTTLLAGATYQFELRRVPALEQERLLIPSCGCVIMPAIRFRLRLLTMELLASTPS